MTKNEGALFTRTESYAPISAQGLDPGDTYSWSVYSMAWANESLPAFMTKEYALAPFDLQTPPAELGNNETWEAPTRLYSLDLACEEAIKNDGNLDSSNGCSYVGPTGSTSPGLFKANYIGYYYSYTSDYSLDSTCPPSVNRTSLIVWQSSISNSSSADGRNITALYCNATYYQQDVRATVLALSRSVVGIAAIGPKVSLPGDMFNITNFEMSLSSGGVPSNGTGSPFEEWPNSRAHLQDMELDLSTIPVMTTLAIAASRKSAEEYLNPKLLHNSHEAAYRLLFARQMVDILKAGNATNASIAGTRHYDTQAVVVVPGFAYAAEALLAVIAVLGICILFLRNQRLALIGDPASIAAQMSLATSSIAIIDQFSSLDQASEKVLEDRISKERYQLSTTSDGKGCTLEYVSHASTTDSLPSHLPSQAQLVRPSEFHTVVGLAFLSIQISLFILLIILYINTNRLNGNNSSF